MRTIDRYVVVNLDRYGNRAPCSRRVFTDHGDAAKVTQRCSRARGATAPCFLLQGPPGGEKLIGRCYRNTCGAPREGDEKLVTRCGSAKKERRGLLKKLYEARKHGQRTKGFTGARRRRRRK